MSQSQQSRTNFYSSESGEYDENREPLDDSKPAHAESSSSTSLSTGTGKEEWIAFGILLEGSTRYCPGCKEDEDLETELSEKNPAPRTHETGDRVVELPYTELKWTCERCGRQCFGGVVPERSIDEFLDVLVQVFDAIGNVPESRRRELRSEAVERKRRDWSDRENLAKVLADL